MKAKLAGGLARLILGLVGMALLAAASLFIVGAWLATWPVLRLSPRQRQLKASLDFATAGLVLAQALGELRKGAPEDPEGAPEPEPEAPADG